MKKVKNLSTCNVALNIAICVSLVISGVFMHHDATINNFQAIQQSSFYLGVLGVVIIEILAALICSLIADRKLKKRTTRLEVCSVSCCLFDGMLFAFAIATWLIIYEETIGTTISSKWNLMIALIYISVAGTACAIAKEIMFKKDINKL